MSTDLTFITNEEGNNLKSRFQALIKDTDYFDVLVGYFYTSGFSSIYPQLINTEKIRILIGISTNKMTYDLIQRVKSSTEVTNEFSERVIDELDQSIDAYSVEDGIKKFLEWIGSGKLEIKAYPDEKIHSKLYIMTFKEGDRDKGRVITGSSNFTQSGLVDNLEFNVELKDYSDYKFAKDKFEQLWDKSIDVSEKYVETIKKKTWLRDDITPYELYLKFLYEYFKDEINQNHEIEHRYRPDNFKQLMYQDHAVINAKRIIEEYGGVFLSDVVGLGKTYMGTMLCQELPGRILILAPPHLIDENNEGSWENAFRNFGFRAKDFRCESIGMLNKLVEKNIHQDYDIVLIDEAHRFRTETTQTYALLAQICRGKKVILVTATPYNNTPKDLLSQIKLFQRPKQSTIPNLPDLEGFFSQLQRNLKDLDRREDREEYIRITKENSNLIREKVLKYLMVRRTRSEIMKYYHDDLENQKMSFPEVAEPEPIFYEFNELEDKIFFETIEIISNEFKYSRYTPLLYYKGVTGPEKTQQRNMMKFMKILLIKRLESSFFAFQQSLNRFISSYEKFIEEYNNGTVYTSSKHINKIFDYLEAEDLEAIDKLIQDDKAEKYAAEDFLEEFIEDLKHDLSILKNVQNLWKDVRRDPKIIAFKEKLIAKDPVKQGKSIIFTESTETAEYLKEHLDKIYPNQILYFSGKSSMRDRETVMENFDANSKTKKNDYKILITTDVLAEGSNLHQASVVINYDIPWNPTRIMQRVGRINRVDTSHEKIYTYTFFPTDQANEQIKLRESAESKIQAFISLLGTDAKLLTEEEVPENHSLFNIILSREAIEGQNEENQELGYLQQIRDIRDNNPELFKKIKRLPKKARTVRISPDSSNSLLTYFRKGKLQKFVISTNAKEKDSIEVDFSDAAKLLSASKDEKQLTIDKLFYELLESNLQELQKITQLDESYSSSKSNRQNSVKVSKILKSIRKYDGFTDEEEEYLEKMIYELDSNSIPKDITKKIHIEISKPELMNRPAQIYYLVKSMMPSEFIDFSNDGIHYMNENKKEIILSEYFKGEIYE